MYSRSSFIASMGSAVASTPLDVVRVSTSNRIFSLSAFYHLNYNVIADSVNESKEDAYYKRRLGATYL